RRLPRLRRRPAAVRAGLRACAPALPRADLGADGPAVGHRDVGPAAEGRREAVPRHEEPLRGQLEPPPVPAAAGVVPSGRRWVVLAAGTFVQTSQAAMYAG